MATVYKVKTKEQVIAHDDGDPTQYAVAWASSEGAARKAKKALCEEHGLKANGADYEAVEVPTSKAGIIDWLNENVKTE